MNIVSTAKISEKHQYRLQEQFHDHTFSFYDHMSETPREVRQETHILLTYGEDLTEEIINQMPHLEWIQVLSAGLDMMPFEALQKRKILVTNASGIHRIPMAEYTMGMILQLARQHYQFYEQQKQGVWDRSPRVDEVYGSTIGILGIGAIGQEIAKRAKAFGMNVMGLRRSKGEKPEYIDEVLSADEKDRIFLESDYLVALLPLTPETTHFIGKAELSKMKTSAYLLNIGRGKVVDEGALIEALAQDEIAGAVLDVFREEPLPPEHQFWTLDQVILTPHVSGRSPLYMTRALQIFEENLQLYPEQKNMTNVIPLDRGY